MSEAKKESGQIVKPSDQLPYNFDFIVMALQLLPINGGEVVINPGSITAIDFLEDGSATLYIVGGGSYDMTPEDLAELEQTIKRRSQEAQILQVEAYKANLRAQQQAANEINSGIQAAQIIGAAPSKRGRN